MSKRTTDYSIHQKLDVVIKAINGEKSINYLATSMGIDWSTLKTWMRKYQADGVSGLEESHTWKRYSLKLKQKAVLDYLEHHLSLAECCQKYNLSGESILRRWINQYNSGKSFQTTRGGSTTMKRKAKKTTLEQRQTIVLDTIKHGKAYQGAVKKYQVSYSQIYNWVRKYERLGVDGLKDHRGQQLSTRAPEELSAEQKYQLKIKQLEQKNQLLAAENFYLKKLRALGRKQK